MHYDRYFRIGQKVVLRRVVNAGAGIVCLDSVAGHLASCSDEYFVIRLQDAAVADELSPGTVFELLGDIYDFGMRLTASLDRAVANGEIRLLPQGNLEFFFRRKYLRAETRLWLGCQRSGSLRTLRRQWKTWSADPAGVPAAALPPFSLQQITLGAGGLGLALPAPVKDGDHVLVFLALDDDQPLICAVAEVVWVEKSGADALHPAGLHFMNLLDSDRRRIELYVRRRLWTCKEENQTS